MTLKLFWYNLCLLMLIGVFVVAVLGDAIVSIPLFMIAEISFGLALAETKITKEESEKKDAIFN